MRVSEITRKTNETDIRVKLNLDGKGEAKLSSGSAFFDHMLNLLARHGGFDLEITCNGDTEVDFHHSAEDIGICLGMAFLEAMGDKRGIVRYADTILPMDEALILSAVDVSGRGYYVSELDIKANSIGNFDCELVDEFWYAFAYNAKITLHVRQLAGKNAHHIIEGVFKSCARSLRHALESDLRFSDGLPSTKGVL